MRQVLTAFCLLVLASPAGAQPPLVTASVRAGGSWWTAWLASHQRDLERCVDDWVPEDAAGIAVVSGTVEGTGTASRWIPHPIGWSAPSLPQERFRLCVDGVFEWAPSEAPTGEVVRIELAVRGGGDVLTVGAVGGSEEDAVGAGEGMGAIGGFGTGASSSSPRERVTPAYTSTQVTSVDETPPTVRPILDGRADRQFRACVEGHTGDADIRFTVTVGERGVVRSVRAQRSDLPRGIRACLEREIRAIQFSFPEPTPRLVFGFTLAVRHHPAVAERLGTARVAASEVRSDGPGTLDAAILFRLLSSRRTVLDRCYHGEVAVRVEVAVTFDEAGEARDVAVTAASASSRPASSAWSRGSACAPAPPAAPRRSACRSI